MLMTGSPSHALIHTTSRTTHSPCTLLSAPRRWSLAPSSARYTAGVILSSERLHQMKRRPFFIHASGENDAETKDEQPSSGLELYLGRIFGTALWYGVLLSFIALCTGVYVFLIINYVDFADIPILNGPQGNSQKSLSLQ